MCGNKVGNGYYVYHEFTHSRVGYFWKIITSFGSDQFDKSNQDYDVICCGTETIECFNINLVSGIIL